MSSDDERCAAVAEPPARAASPMCSLPQDALHNILSRLDLRQALTCAAACRLLRDALGAPPFPGSLPPLRLLALRHPRPSATSSPTLYALDPSDLRWLRIPLSFLPFNSPLSPVAATASLLLLWADISSIPSNPSHSNPQSRSLVICNPLARAYRVLPPLGSAWSRHGTVLAAVDGAAIVLTELAALIYSQTTHSWLKFSLNLPSKPRSPILISQSLFALCDVGSPWRSQWKLFACGLSDLGGQRAWAPLDRPEWGDIFDILKRPRLVPGGGGDRRRILMIGGLRSFSAIDAPCSTVLILRLDLDTMYWDEAGRMPDDMYRCFAGTAVGGHNSAGVNNKVKVFGGGGKVWFSGKKVKGKLAMWVEDGGGNQWHWVEGLPGYSEGVYRGFVFDAGFTAMP